MGKIYLHILGFLFLFGSGFAGGYWFHGVTNWTNPGRDSGGLEAVERGAEEADRNLGDAVRGVSDGQSEGDRLLEELEHAE